MDLEAIKRLISLGIEKNELKSDTPIDIVSHTIIDLLYGQLLCWCMSDGIYSLKERTEEFCNMYLSLYLKQYLI